MTYPQQSGQHDPWGQQQWGQQPGGDPQQQWGQQYGQPQQPYGQPDPYGQQPGGQYPGSGPQQAWPQQGWGQPQPGQQWGQVPPGHPGQPMAGPPNKKSKLPWILGGTGGGLLIIGGIITLTFVLTAGNSPKEVANRFAGIYEETVSNPKNPPVDKYREIMCSDLQSDLDKSAERQRELADNYTQEDLDKAKKTTAEVRNLEHSEKSGSFEMELNNPEESNSNTLKFGLKKEDGDWKVCTPPDSSSN